MPRLHTCAYLMSTGTFLGQAFISSDINRSLASTGIANMVAFVIFDFHSTSIDQAAKSLRLGFGYIFFPVGFGYIF